MGCGGAVNRLLVDKIEEGIVQNLEAEEGETPNIDTEYRTANAQRRNEVLISGIQYPEIQDRGSSGTR